MRFLRELEDFASFLFSLWGLLAGLSVFLPLANTWWEVLPLQSGQFRLATGLATLTCYFALVYSFAERHRLRTALRLARHAPPGWEPEHASLSSALSRFGWSLACLAFYFILNVGHSRVSVQSGDWVELTGSFLVPLVAISYSLVFGLLTAAIAELAMIEYVKGQPEEPAALTAGR